MDPHIYEHIMQVVKEEMAKGAQTIQQPQYILFLKSNSGKQINDPEPYYTYQEVCIC